jgi:hypothetical protein
MKVRQIDFAKVVHWRRRLREPLAQSALSNEDRDADLAEAVAVAATMQRIQDRAAELLAEHGDDDASMAAVEAALEVLGGSDEC